MSRTLSPLLILASASFLLTGCPDDIPTVPTTDSEGTTSTGTDTTPTATQPTVTATMTATMTDGMTGETTMTVDPDTTVGPETTETPTTDATTGTTDATTGTTDATTGTTDATTGTTDATTGTTDGTTGTTDATTGTTDATTGTTGGNMATGYGDCLNNDPMVACTMDEVCVTDGMMPPGIGVCSDQTCAGAMDCPAAPPTGNAVVTCQDVTGDMNNDCWLSCAMGETCPDGMGCFLDFICVFELPPPPPMGYGDCANNDPMVACLAGEVCLTDGMMPPTIGVCSEQGCGGVMDCAPAPGTGNPTVACQDVTGDMMAECVLDCSMGEVCPDGMDCFAGFVCVWPAGGGGMADFTCSDGNLGSATGAAVAMGTTAGAADDFVPGCTGGNQSADAQFQWTAPADGMYTFDTIGSGFDTILTVHTDCVGGEIACNDDLMAGFLQSEVTVTLAAGESVLIVIDGYNETGNYVLNIN